jgi:hypothetical protein
MRPTGDDERRAVQFAVDLAINLTKPSAVTLPTIFNPLAITVPLGFVPNIVSSL